MSRRTLSQQEIVRAATELADDGGLDHVTVTAVAKQLEVSPPSLYKHVRGREGLIQLLATRAVLGAASAMSTAIAGRSGVDAVQAGAAAFRTYALRHPGVWDATLPRPGGAPEPTPLQIAAHHRMHDLFQAMLRAWDTDPALKLDVIRALQAGLHGFVLLERAGGYSHPRAASTSYEALVATLVAPLGEPAAPATTGDAA